jgi:hypothetical protein
MKVAERRAMVVVPSGRGFRDSYSGKLLDDDLSSALEVRLERLELP